MLPLLCALPAALRAQVSFGEATRFDDGWLFRLGDDTTARRPAYDDASWRRLRLPHDWSVAVSYTHLRAHET